MDKHLQQLAATHLETKFIKVGKDYTEAVFVKQMVIEHRPEQLLQKHAYHAQIDAEKAPFLVERLKIWMLPTLALVKLEKTVDYVVGFDELGGRDDFPTKVWCQCHCAWYNNCNVCRRHEFCIELQVLKERLERAGIIKDVTPNVPSARQRKNIRHDCYSRNDSDEDSDF